MTDLRDRYAEALLKRMDGHEGPLSDLAPVMERLDVLAGVDLEQKRLSAPDGTPRIEGSTPVIEHGSGLQAGDSASVAGSPTVSAGPEHRAVLHDPAPLPVVHEEPQQEPVSASAGQQANDGASAGSDPAAASPAPARSAMAARRDPAPGSRSLKERRLCDCGCGNELTIWPYERKAKPEGPFYLNREHAAVGRRQRNAEARNATPEKNSEVEAQNCEPLPGDTPAIQAEVEENRPEVEEPARGLAAIISNSPVAAAPPGKFVCACPDWWRQKTAGWHEDVPNEGHHDDCPLYRKGGHRWPMPAQGSERNEPFTIMCGWCNDQRDVDRYGVEWTKSDVNPAVTITNPYNKNGKALA